MFQSVYLQCVHMLPIETSNRSLSKLPDGKFPTEVIETAPNGSLSARFQVQSTMVGAVQYRGSIDAARTILATERTPNPLPAVVQSVNQVQAEQSHAKV